VKARRRIKKATVTHISLVHSGANQKTILWKSGDEPVHSTVATIAKTDDEQRMVYGIVYAPDQVDNQGDVADAEVIRDMAYTFMKMQFTPNVDRQHNYMGGEGYVAESWLLRKNDALFPKEPEGSWAVGIKVEKDDTWQAIKDGAITGISMAGEGAVEVLQKADDDPDESFVQKIIDGVSRLFEKHTGDSEMETTDLEKTVASAVQEAFGVSVEN